MKPLLAIFLSLICSTLMAQQNLDAVWLRLTANQPTITFVSGANSQQLYTSPSDFMEATSSFIVGKDLTVFGSAFINGNLTVTGVPVLYLTNNVWAANYATNAPDGSLIISSNYAMATFPTNIFQSKGGVPQANIIGVPSARGSTVIGGVGNIIGATGSGSAQTQRASCSIISGGQGNTITNSPTSVIAGGGFNSIGDLNITTGFNGVIGGGQGNIINYAQYATIPGGINNSIISLGNQPTNAYGAAIGGGWGNYINMQLGTIAGGDQNVIGPLLQPGGGGAVIGGGNRNYNVGDAGTIAGGEQNTNLAATGFIGGGGNNLIPLTGQGAVVAGGFGNTCAGTQSTVGGGQGNDNEALYSVIPGGLNNGITHLSDYSFAAGYNAHAVNAGCFVWNDGNGASYSTTVPNQVCFKAQNGLKLDGGPFQGNALALTNQLAAPSAVANQCILWYSNNTALYATTVGGTKLVLIVP